MRKLISLSLILIATVSMSLSAQEKSLGIKGTVGTSEGSTYYTTGLDFEHKLSTNWGYTFGVYHKTNMVFNPVKLFFIHIPVTAKYYTRYVNVSAGLSGDYFIGNSTPAGLTNVRADLDPAFQLGFYGSVSKDIQLTKNFIIEPEIYINPTINGALDYYGVGLSLKYVFRD